MVTDAELAREAQQGDRSAWAKLWDRYGLEAQRWAFAVTGDLGDAEEASQEAFTQALERLPALRDPGRFGGWLRQIVRFKAVDLVRSRQRTTQIDVYDLAPGSQGAIETHGSYTRSQPDVALERKQMLLALETALARLPHKYAEIVHMFYFENQSQESIARLLGTTIPAVKGTLFRAKYLLRKEMDHERRGTSGEGRSDPGRDQGSSQ